MQDREHEHLERSAAIGLHEAEERFALRDEPREEHLDQEVAVRGEQRRRRRRQCGRHGGTRRSRATSVLLSSSPSSEAGTSLAGFVLVVTISAYHG